jgi:hypothetical protein
MEYLARICPRRRRPAAKEMMQQKRLSSKRSAAWRFIEASQDLHSASIAEHRLSGETAAPVPHSEVKNEKKEFESYSDRCDPVLLGD